MIWRSIFSLCIVVYYVICRGLEMGAELGQNLIDIIDIHAIVRANIGNHKLVELVPK